MVVIFILSHNRPEDQPTVDSLKKSDNNLPIYIVVGDDDPQLDKYKSIFKDKLLIFSKEEINIDPMDNFSEWNTPLYARKFIQDYTLNNNIEEYIMLDDDYDIFGVRYAYDDGVLHQKRIKNISELFTNLFKIARNMKTLQLCFGQNGDYIGGANSRIYQKGVLYKCMNVFLCSKDRPIPFQGIFNDDVNGGINLVKTGIIPITLKGFVINQEKTQEFDGGITGLYKKYGTYVKSFYSVMLCPTGVRLRLMGDKYYRVHHQLKQEHITPKIIEEKYKKV